MSEKLKQIDPAGLLNEECSDQEMDTQDQPGSHGEPHVQKKKTVHHVSSSGEEEEEEGDASAAAENHPTAAITAVTADTADTTPVTAHAVTNPGFRIVDIEMPGSGSGFPALPFQPVQTSTTTYMNLNPQTGANTSNPQLQLPDPAENNSRPATVPVPGQTQTGTSEKLSAAIAKAREQNRNVKNVESGGKNNKNDNSFKKVPTGVKKPEIPPKNSDVSEADAVPSKTYSAIISNKKKNEKASTIGGIASGQDPTECGSFFNPGDNRILRSVYKEDVTSGSVSSMSFNPVTWMCTACPRSHSVFEVRTGEGGRAGGRTVIVLCDQNFPAVLPSVENHCLSIMRLDSGTIEELIDLFLKMSKNVTVPEGTVILVGSVSLLARVGVHGYSSACINAKRRLTGAIKGVVVVPFIPPPMGGCNDTEVIRSVIDTSIWLSSIPGYALSDTSKGLVDMVMDDIAVEVGGGGGDPLR
jgi:hypothetical protein